MIKLGSLVRDSVTGFEGVVIGRTEYLHDKPSVGILARKLKDGRPIKVQWITESRVIVVADSGIIAERPVHMPVGSSVEDIITGFAGVVTARTEYLYCTNEVLVKATTLNDGEPIAAQWMSASRVKVVREVVPADEDDTEAAEIAE